MYQGNLDLKSDGSLVLCLRRWKQNDGFGVVNIKERTVCMQNKCGFQTKSIGNLVYSSI